MDLSTHHHRDSRDGRVPGKEFPRAATRDHTIINDSILKLPVAAIRAYKNTPGRKKFKCITSI